MARRTRKTKKRAATGPVGFFRRRWRGLGLGLFVALLIPYLAVLAYLYKNQDRMVFPASGPAYDQCKEIMDLGGLPKTELVGGETVRYIELTGKNPKAWLILFHGNGGSVCHRAYHARHLRAAHLNLVMAEYPGYGGDPQAPTEKRLLRNALAVYDGVRRRAGGRPIFVMGKSLGSGVATYVASQRDVDGLVLHTPYTSLTQLGMSPLVIGVSLLLKNQFNAHRWAPQVRAPVLALHGEDDRIIPYANGREQLNHFQSPVTLQAFKNTNHHNIGYNESDRYFNAIDAFLDSRLDALGIER